MFSNRFGSALLMLAGFAQADPERITCQDRHFCSRYQSYAQDCDGSYKFDMESLDIQHSEGKLSATLKYEVHEDSDACAAISAADLSFSADFYQNGIARFLIEEPNSNRFRISSTGLPIVDEQLHHAAFKTSQLGDSVLRVEGLSTHDQREHFSYEFGLDSLSISLLRNGDLALTSNLMSNSNNSLLVEQEPAFFVKVVGEDGEFVNQDDQYFVNSFTSVGMGFQFALEDSTLYGIPEKESSVIAGDGTYRLFNQDLFPHVNDDTADLYGDIPYLTVHSPENGEASLIWVNSADSFYQVSSMPDNKGKEVYAISEGGAMEFFMMASPDPKSMQKNLADVSGYSPLPPLYMMGFQFAKWAEVSEDIIMDRNKNFTEYGFPVDVFWMDIEYSNDYMYFEFNPKNFTEDGIQKMNQEVEDANRRLVVIVDPHIKAAEEFHIYTDGIELQSGDQPEGNVTNIFVRNSEGETFYGNCWPGNSTWIDFLNVNAQQFWQQQFAFTNFKGSNYLYNFWNDMNEPALFDVPTKTMPLDNKHVMTDGTVVLHRDLHNAYGALQQRASHEGIIKRNEYERRPFVLTRSFFLGSQKYGTMWTGDNQSTFGDIKGSMNQLLNLGVSGLNFGGSDIPGFYGFPEDNVWVQFYQLGMFYPFFRAHTNIECPYREPWLQSDRVQEVIRSVVYLRYSFIYHVQNLFFQASVSGDPLMRTMWNEFPRNQGAQNLDTQFMFGREMLVAPKLGGEIDTNDFSTQVNVYLPKDEPFWYNYFSKNAVASNDNLETMTIPDEEIALFVKAGSILPILLHQKELSLLNAIKNPIGLELYLGARAEAFGQLYLDDGDSFEYQTQRAKTLVHYHFHDNVLSAVKALPDDFVFDGASQKLITDVTIFGNQFVPSSVTDLATGQDLEFDFDANVNSLTIMNLVYPVDDGLRHNQPRDLLRVSYNNDVTIESSFIQK